MKVVTDTGTIDLGKVETAPTIGVIDYSRRVTDDFGVTTVVKRGFARRMSVRLAVPFDQLDALQRQLAALRAAPATWIADERFASLAFRGVYKEFELDVSIPPVSFCTLTVEGLADYGAYADDGSNPAPSGGKSSLQVLQPLPIVDSILTSSSVAEADAGEWSASTSYAAGARVIKAAAHRVYESIIAGNRGADPATTTGAWLDAGPTNRWAMFDQAIGSLTTAAAAIAVTLKPSAAVNGLAVLDTNADTVRVQAPSYDRTQTIAGATGSAVFLDLVAAAGAAVTITITPRSGTPAARPAWTDGSAWQDEKPWRDTAAGDGTVSVGTVMVGTVRSLGTTEASPTAGITDFSRKETDEFGETTLVPRAWAKRMSAKALIRTDAVDQVVSRIAALRALPSLWLADRALDSLTVYGFFKDFSIEVGETVSKLSLSIEGFSEATTPPPFAIPWENITDPNGTKPTDGADNTGSNTSKDTDAVGGRPAGQVLADADSVKRRSEILENNTVPAINKAVDDAFNRIEAEADIAAEAVGAANDRIEEAATAAAEGFARANGRIDGAVSDLAKEVSRAQGADELLYRQIDALSVRTSGADAEVRALIETERLVRSDDVRSIGQRIDSVVTDYTSKDTATRSLLTSQVTALSAVDKAIGERIDAVIVSFKAADDAANVRITDSVAALAAADAAIGKRVDAIVTDVTTKDTAARAEISRVELASSTRDSALGQRLDTVTADYIAANAATNTRITQQVTALSDANLALGQRIDSVVTGYTGLNTATNSRITQEVSALSDANAAVGRRVDSIIARTDAGSQATIAEIQQAATAAATANQSVADLSTSVTSRFSGVATSLGNFDQRISTLSDALGGYVQRTSALEASARATDTALNGSSGVLARLSNSEAVLVDLPNNYATTQRVSDLEAQVTGSSGDLTAKINERVTAIVDPKIGAVTQSVTDLSSDYAGTKATVQQQAGTLVDLAGKQTAYVRLLADGGNGVARLSLWSDQYGGAWELTGDGRINGNLTIDGTLNTSKIADGAITTALAAQSLQQATVPWEDSSVHYGVQATIPNASGAAVRIDARSLTSSGGQGAGPPFSIALERYANGQATVISATVATTGGILLDYPPANTAVTYRFRYGHQYATQNGTSVVIYQQLFVLELKK